MNNKNMDTSSAILHYHFPTNSNLGNCNQGWFHLGLQEAGHEFLFYVLFFIPWKSNTPKLDFSPGVLNLIFCFLPRHSLFNSGALRVSVSVCVFQTHLKVIKQLMHSLSSILKWNKKQKSLTLWKKKYNNNTVNLKKCQQFLMLQQLFQSHQETKN